jgi:hypothetical protein
MHPRHRGDCADFFAAQNQTNRIDLDAPGSTIGEIEHAAAKAGRSWCDQFTYLMGVVMGSHLPDFDDARSVEDWRTLMNPCRLRLRKAEAWIPCACLWGNTP